MSERAKRFFQALSIRYRLLLTFFALLCVVTAGVTFSVNYYNRRFIRGMMEESSRQMMREMNAELDAMYDRINQMYLTFNNQQLYEIFRQDPSMTNFQRVQKELKYENLMKNLIHANNLQTHIEGVLLYGGEGYLAYVGSGSLNRQFRVEDSLWYREFSENSRGKLTYGPLLEDFKNPVSTRSEVIYLIRSWNIPHSSGIEKSGHPFILMCMDVGGIRDVLARFGGDTRVMLAADQEGEVLFSVNMEGEEGAALLERIRENRATLARGETYFDRHWVITETKNEKFGWAIYSAESTADAFLDMNRLLRNIYLIILAAGGVAVVLAVYLSRKVVMPITLLYQMIQKLEEKDVYLEVHTRDELGQIGERFNQMKHRLQELNEQMYLSQVQEKEAQLRSLQAQINPHFLYNTLDNIYCIAQLEGNDHITRLTENLSKMMRYSMSMKERYVPLVRELEHVKAYLDILNIRFDNSIALKVEVEEPYRSIELPKLSLQPLAENAWNHGILPKPGHHGTIRFIIGGEGDECCIQVLDDGVGISREKCRELNKELQQVSYEPASFAAGSGIALKNVNNRIMLEDGEEYGVRIYPGEDGGCRVEVRMKLKNVHLL